MDDAYRLIAEIVDGAEPYDGAIVPVEMGFSAPPVWDKDVPIQDEIASKTKKPRPKTPLIGDKKSKTDADAALDLECSTYSANDTGNAARLLKRFGDKICFVREVGAYCWVGTHWDGEGGSEHAVRLAKAVSKHINDEAKALLKAGANSGESSASFERRVARHFGFANTSGNKGRIDSMISLSSAENTLAPEKLDANPLQLNVQNGTLHFGVIGEGELRSATVELQPHNINDYISKLVLTDYDPDAQCPIFMAFLNKIMPDPQIKLFLQMWFGYCLTGITSEQKLVFFYGEGANGKSTLVDLFAKMLSGYSASLRFESLAGDSNRRGDAATPDLAQLTGKRFVRAAEPEEGIKFKEAEVKAITGGEAMLVRHLQKGFFELQPKFKLNLSGNHKPNIRGLDEGIWRRILLVPFEVKIPKPERDLSLDKKLWQERSGFLNWCLDGLRLYLERGLVIPDGVQAATEAYKGENDILGDFLRDCTEPDLHGSVQAGELYKAYVHWCDGNAVRPWSGTAFGKGMTSKHIEKIKSRINIYKGIRLLEEARAPQPQFQKNFYG